MNRHKISIITAVYNNASMIVGCLDAILDQCYLNIEVIIIDGGSTDGTLELIQKYKNIMSVIVSEPDNGLYDALNKGISLATGDVVGFMHSDDLFYDQHTLYKVATAFSNHNIDAVYGDLIYVDKENTDKVVRQWR